jgi:hypothetical protein
LNQEIVPWQPKPKKASETPVATATAAKAERVPANSGKSAAQRPVASQPASQPAVMMSTYAEADEDTKREMRRIQNIMTMEIPASDKVKQLSRIEMEAKRNIELEQEKIKELKQQK